jgi:large subunit ribosomal protein L24
MKIKKNDAVLIISGKYKGKTGKVEKSMPKNNKVIISGVNIAKKHTKPTRKNPKGGIIEINVPIDVSNVMLICPKCNKKTRIGNKWINKRKIRYCKKCNEEI